MIPLKVEYGTVQGNQIVYSPVIARYKNVTGAPIPLYIRVSGDNFEEKIFSGTILIEKLQIFSLIIRMKLKLNI